MGSAPKNSNNEPAVLDTESIHVTIEVAPKTKDGSDGNQNGKEQSKSRKKSSTTANPQESSATMRNVELSTERIQQGFGN